MNASAATSGWARAARRRRLLGAAIGALTLVQAAGVTCPRAVAQSQPSAPAAPTPTAAPDADQPKSGGKPLENVEPLASDAAASVMGKKVKGPNGEDLGLIVDVLVDPEGKPRAAVIDFGGFLGVGSRKIAIDWKALNFTSLGRAGTVELGLDRAQIAAAPEYKPGPPGADVVTAPPAPAPPVDTHK